MIYCIDIDETLSHSSEDDYAHAVPVKEAIYRVNKLYDDGHYIKLFTGRGSWDNYDWREFTEKQLNLWGVKYHELILKKPHYDVFVDDKAINTSDWLGDEISDVKKVVRTWGTEWWIVNCDEYCGKLLVIPKSSDFQEGEHYHKSKKETFYCLRGQVLLMINGRECILDPLNKPVTLHPSDRHKFRGLTNSLILEISMHHEDDDTFWEEK